MSNYKITFRLLLAAVIIVPLIMVGVFGFGIGGAKYKKYVDHFDQTVQSTAGAEVRTYVAFLSEKYTWEDLSANTRKNVVQYVYDEIRSITKRDDVTTYNILGFSSGGNEIIFHYNTTGNGKFSIYVSGVAEEEGVEVK